MIVLPHHLYKQYQAFCGKSGVTGAGLVDHFKWLRYFLDFCEKYKVAGEEAHRTSLFLKKLEQKGQPEEKRKQAQHAVNLYFKMIRGSSKDETSVYRAQGSEAKKLEGKTSEKARLSSDRKSFYLELGYQENPILPSGT
ncbi:hypothetical protein [Geotalea daltonii]|uniref:hypothetical protein n=1 Tax=Geotalea daltonii TaxID=1203471 RepID=UPI001E4E9F3D|nr:hypothetical protein [Geotalea daltonii]